MSMRALGISMQFTPPKGSVFTPSALFAAGEQGVWFDPSDFSSMFQDSAGTIPVTAAGQPVGKINDKSGRGNHATQATAASRPTLQQDGTGRYYLDFDGVDDCMATGNIPYTTDKMVSTIGIRRGSDNTRCMLVEHTNSSTGRYSIEAPTDSVGKYFAGSGGSIVVFTPNSAVFNAPDMAVVTLVADIAADALAFRRNGVQLMTQNTNQGTGNYNNLPMYIGARGLASLFYLGRIYGIVSRALTTDAGTLSQLESWMNGKTGAY